MVAADRASVSLYGEQPLTLPSSPWVQRADVAARLTRQTLLDLRLPQTVITDLAIRGDPRLQLLDRVRVIDRDGIGVDHHWWITGLRETHTPDGGYTMHVDARQALPVAVWGQHRYDHALWGHTP